ncbi:MAG: YdhR family protein [Chloroflexi bacterium]|nr:YdhR family protein [Chloroflexota bacterium]
MSEKLLQLNFKFSVTGDEYTQAVSPLAEKYAAVPGLRWKVWIINEAESEAGGIYLFDDETSLKGLMESSLTKQVTSHPALSDFNVKIFDVMDEATAITRGPI